ncbi:MAG: phage major capsid protein [Thioclava sp.]|nr:phage major capsid protein [Thioclava sp.]MBD3803566.1 phage major capsid protein [Thioclava sp.]
MSKITELREQAMQITADARSKLTEADKPGKTADEVRALNQEFDALMEKRDALKEQADRLERADRADRESEEVRERMDREARDGRRATGGAQEFQPDGNADAEYRGHFRDFLASGGDLSAISNEARSALRRGMVEERAGQTTATGPAGGYTVPSTIANFIAIGMAATGPMLNGDVVSLLNTATGAGMIIPGLDDTANEGEDHVEGDDVTAKEAALALIKADLSAFTTRTKWFTWSFELAQDSSFAWEAILGRVVGERLGRRANKLLTTGTGVGQPLGHVTGAAVGATATANNALTFDDIIELEHSIDPAYRNGPRVGYQMHDQTVKVLRKIKDLEGRYVWQDGDLVKGVPDMLNRKPVHFNQAMDQIGASKDVITFGDFGTYYTRQVGGPLLGVAREMFFPNLGIAGVLRFDGALSDPRAIKKLRMAA